ncbi:uncharacterized membrane protein YjjP (DUF1212 family) [Dysgonomonas sp. PFB1-18]|uniref:threonine/serine ThrE exporter family protein n=1 Tax=unclassified Dysgonomonas TaxID=2630389 RepID=UPI002473FDB4|nr:MULTISPECIES: threonine/serine exporter family protein [unclassified Dysgonomonas]MDH6307903.1 uncharacterized membrane protein YjjP (DUF1212 family) [Dysgonomonas sp. PF1-14]MDH6337821.1 uncharacterized membrane protein YjjP (DUF1212 family) [Dysgonomonas sp. PF1-16]MDH6379045.1 uncharacterized membrane protein YjjP (DUF1212 family) [Dysgonomonas sp. PFB1-18]MDH6396680.1 uncharacterized membrane protein YjjP (DUF1212 family) [Dysgonomonas sp. PF1-23]
MPELTDRVVREKIPAQRFADLILDIGTYLLASGAHCGRINSNLGRLASTWEFDINMSLTFKGLLVTVRDINDPSNSVTCYKNSPPHSVHLAVLTEISHLSWKVQEENLSITEVEKEFAGIKEKPNYKDIVVAVAVGFSCAGLCLFSMGDEKNAMVAFCAAFIGFMVKSLFAKKKFNPMICISIAAFVTTLITGLGRIYGIGEHPEAAMATAVLYLIPGVPLINCVIDLIEGYLSSAINRALFGGFILLCIAAGMTLCITLMGIGNF